MKSKNIVFSDAMAIAKAIRERETSCVEVMSSFLNHIRSHNEAINAISDLRSAQELLAEAAEKDRLLDEEIILGPLHGIPMTVKDGFCVEGLRSTNGNPQLKNNIPGYDATLVKRLKKAGAIIIGKTNIAYLAMDWQTKNSWFGRTNNPYNLRKTAGGSSGGSAAALAAGFTPLELGTDAGGSIRVPAHFCGVCGIRPTESALPNRGNMVTPKLPKVGRYLLSNGAMARNTQDLMLVMEVLWGDDQEHTENPPVPFKRKELRNGEKINIAFSYNLGYRNLGASYAEVYQDFIGKVKDSFEHVVEDMPSYNSRILTVLWGKIAGYDLASALRYIPFKSLITRMMFKKMYKHSIWAKGMSLGAGSNAFDYARTLEVKDIVGDMFHEFFDQYDVWITPVAITEAIDHHKTGKPIKIDNSYVPYGEAFIPYNFPSTIPGHPIVVIPIGKTTDGLPVGVQLHGKRWNDYRLLQIAKMFEQITEGFVKPDLNGINSN